MGSQKATFHLTLEGYNGGGYHLDKTTTDFVNLGATPL